jgi:hypothetical protein
VIRAFRRVYRPKLRSLGDLAQLTRHSQSNFSLALYASGTTYPKIITYLAAGLCLVACQCQPKTGPAGGIAFHHLTYFTVLSVIHTQLNTLYLKSQVTRPGMGGLHGHNGTSPQPRRRWTSSVKSLLVKMLPSSKKRDDTWKATSAEVNNVRPTQLCCQTEFVIDPMAATRDGAKS